MLVDLSLCIFPDAQTNKNWGIFGPVLSFSVLRTYIYSIRKPDYNGDIFPKTGKAHVKSTA